MSRREILTAIELTLATSALTACTYGLVRASYDPYAAVEWVPIAIVGVATALSITGLAALLAGGRLALLLAAEAFHARGNDETPPPSARAALRRPRNDDGLFDAYVAERAGMRRHAEPVTAPVPAEKLAPAGQDAAGGGR